MTGGSHVVGLWTDRNGDARADEPPLDLSSDDMIVEEEPVLDPDEETPRRDWIGTSAWVVCLGLAALWLGFVATLDIGAAMGMKPGLDSLALSIAMACPPLAVIGLLYTLMTRGGRAEGRRFGVLAAEMRAEQGRLEATLSHVSARLDGEKAALAAASSDLLALGDDAAVRMKGVGDAMRGEVDLLGRHAHALKHSAAAARADVAVLLSDLPKAHVQTRSMIAALDQAGLTAHERAGALDAMLSSLTQRGREADEIAGGAAQKLAAHLSRVEGVSETAGARLEEAAGQMTTAVDAALDRASQATDAARQGMEAQGAAMLALVEQCQAALARTGQDSAEAITTRVDDVSAKLETLGAALGAHVETSSTLLATVRDGLDGVDARLEALDTNGTARSERLGVALAGLDGHATSLTAAMQSGAEAADVLIGRAETLIPALDAANREIGETLPASFDRLDARAEASRAAIATAAPEIARMEREAGAALDRLLEAEAALAKQRAALDALGVESAARLAEARSSTDALVAAANEADATVRGIAEGAGAQLVEAMVRVRETAQAAADRAREAIAQIIPESAAQLSEASREALTRAISEQVEAQIAELGATAERAVETAHKASDRLMRQMLTIADTSAQVEARIAEARAEVEDSDRDNFARRVALLIESLNSTAIDVTKILSNDVTDSAWAAYLRGDRGIFTRRAVRLLDSGEVREIARHYGEEPEFREQVNRYIHDFEAMLRSVLATRDASPLGITLLSSDMGKLYVALAQAIERLRS